MKEYSYKPPLISLGIYAGIIAASNDISMWWWLTPLLIALVFFLVFAVILRSLRGL